MLAMLDAVSKKIAELQDLEAQMSDPEVLSDPSKLAKIGKRIADLKPLEELHKEYLSCEAAIKEVDNVRDDPELLAMAEEEATSAKKRLSEIEEEMRVFLVPRDEDDDRDVILEVRAGTGGDEAALFAAELLRMYLRYSEEQNWTTEIMDKSDADAGGIKDAVCSIKGAGCYGVLKFESGVHRVQRIPATESKGRIHTSAASIAILPEAEDVDIQIDPNDLEIDVYRSSGPGGQSVNTTDSAVRITHKPTGIIVTCQDEKSQLKNKNKAMGVLKSRLYAEEKERLARERGEMRLGQIGSGDRSEKIRTYNFPQDRVTDHRLGQNFNNLPGIMEGDIGPVVEALQAKDLADRMEQAS